MEATVQVQPFPEHLDGLRRPNFKYLACNRRDRVPRCSERGGMKGRSCQSPFSWQGRPESAKRCLSNHSLQLQGGSRSGRARRGPRRFQIAEPRSIGRPPRSGTGMAPSRGRGAANGVLLLDELDKAGGDERCRPKLHCSISSIRVPRDGSSIKRPTRVAMDASALWKVGTANNLNRISGRFAPLKSS